jgi:hypothetical protein
MGLSYRLKIPWPRGCEGSSPSVRTNKISGFSVVLDTRIWRALRLGPYRVRKSPVHFRKCGDPEQRWDQRDGCARLVLRGKDRSHDHRVK